jgi:hypothetical protein
VMSGLRRVVTAGAGRWGGPQAGFCVCAAMQRSFGSGAQTEGLILRKAGGLRKLAGRGKTEDRLDNLPLGW